jgi:hypothetical protein
MYKAKHNILALWLIYGFITMARKPRGVPFHASSSSPNYTSRLAKHNSFVYYKSFLEN